MARATQTEPRWLAYHVFYHGPLEQVLLRLVYPAFRELWLRDRTRRFFFLRYALGGPHVRLRLRGAPAGRQEVERVLHRRAASFFARFPAAQELSEAVIRERNRRILATDPDGVDAVYPNHSVIELPFHPEVERYGGAELIDDSLTFCVVASAHALRFLERRAGESKSRRLSGALRMLLRQALGFAADGDELLRLLAYAAVREEDACGRLIARADQEFARQPESYLRLAAEEIALLAERDPRRRPRDCWLGEAARRLRGRIRGASDPARWRIMGSHLHLSANRIGLSVPEEIYLGRLLGRAVRCLLESAPAAADSFQAAMASAQDLESAAAADAAAGAGLEAVAALSLAELFATRGGSEASCSPTWKEPT
jgi:hypothetical protein